MNPIIKAKLEKRERELRDDIERIEKELLEKKSYLYGLMDGLRIGQEAVQVDDDKVRGGEKG